MLNKKEYELSIESGNNKITYYIILNNQKIVVTKEVYEQFVKFNKEERNTQRSMERHYEYSELMDETLYKRLFLKPKNLEEIVHEQLIMQEIYEEIDSLPEIQRRRFIQYYFYDYTYEKIAELNGCTNKAARFSVARAKEKIIKKIKEFL